MKSTLLMLLACMLNPTTVVSYNILALYPVRVYSHFAVLNAVATELANAGHNVTVYSKYLPTHRNGNYGHVELVDCFPLKNQNNRYNSVDYLMKYAGSLGFLMHQINLKVTYEEISSCKPIMDLIDTTDKYDVLLLESFNGHTDTYTGLASKLNIPYIGISTSPLYPWLSERMGTPDNPSYIPVVFTGYSSEMTFIERFFNTFAYMVSKLMYSYIVSPQTEEVAKQLFGDSMPPLDDLLKNCSIMFTYTHFSVTPLRPLVPNVVEIGGINIKNVSTLPKDVEKFINESEHGVILFSLGSYIHSQYLPKQTVDSILKAFYRLKERVIWKWEGDSSFIDSKKVFTSQWLPQRDILAHPKVKLFISHGGLLGVNEAVHAGIPVLGIPLFSDQISNINRLKLEGLAESLEYKKITEESMYQKVQQIVTNSSYKENALRLSEIYRDRPISPHRAVVFWTEYVVRHNGAHHLRSAVVDMPFYEYLLLDVIAFIIACLAVSLCAVYYVIKILLKIIKKIFTQFSSKSESNKIKIN